MYLGGTIPSELADFCTAKLDVAKLVKFDSDNTIRNTHNGKNLVDLPSTSRCRWFSTEEIRHFIEVLDSGEVQSANRAITVVPDGIELERDDHLAPETHLDSFNAAAMVLTVKGKSASVI